MDEDEVMGRQMEGAVHLLTASSQLDVFDLGGESTQFGSPGGVLFTFAIRVLSIAIFARPG